MEKELEDKAGGKKSGEAKVSSASAAPAASAGGWGADFLQKNKAAVEAATKAAGDDIDAAAGKKPATAGGEP